MMSLGTSVELRSCVQCLEQEVGSGFRRAVRVQRDGGERSRFRRVHDNGLAAGRAATVSEPDRVHFFNDSTIASAVPDRLLHHGETVVIEGASYRMKDKDNS